LSEVTSTLAQAWALRLDVTLVEVHRALTAAGVRPLLLKGPAIAHWLYDDDASDRAYVDIDLLVSPHDAPAAAAVLAQLDFVALRAGFGDTSSADRHAQTWRREPPRLAHIDLHHRFAGIGAGSAAIWEALTEHAVTLRVAGHDVEALDDVGLALIVGLHAAAHGLEHGQPGEDLERALERVPHATWTAATALARRLDAEQSFALGLRRLPRGAQLAQHLELTTEVSTHAVLMSGGAGSRGAFGYQQLAAARGVRGRARVLRAKALPSRAFMAHWAPWTRRGPAALALGYGWRIASLLRAAPRGVALYRAARATSRSTRGPATRQRRTAGDLRAALWTARCVRHARRDLRASGLTALHLPPPPTAGREDVVTATLKTLRANCLVEASVRQAWLAAHGDARDLVIGATPGTIAFRAHAWLEGDPALGREDFVELARKPPPPRRR
jgi:hypothetical protein